MMRHIITLPGLVEANRKLDLLLAGGGIIVPPDPEAPAITTPAGIQSDGTPQVGETLTGIDPVGNGPIVARRWIAGGVTVATAQTYAPTAAGSLRYEADLQGPDGTTATSGSTITVAASGTPVISYGLSADGPPSTVTPASVTVTGPATIVEGTGGATPASVTVTGPATITEGNSSASVAVTGPSTITEGN